MQTFPEQYVAKRLEREEQVLNRALQDADFRKELVASPRATLSSLYGVSIPDEADVQVFEETTNSHHVVIPPDLAQMNEELTDEQLEAVIEASPLFAKYGTRVDAQSAREMLAAVAERVQGVVALQLVGLGDPGGGTHGLSSCAERENSIYH